MVLVFPGDRSVTLEELAKQCPLSTENSTSRSCNCQSSSKLKFDGADIGPNKLCRNKNEKDRGPKNLLDNSLKEATSGDSEGSATTSVSVPESCISPKLDSSQISENFPQKRTHDLNSEEEEGPESKKPR